MTNENRGYTAAGDREIRESQKLKARPIIEELRKPLGPNEGFATMYERLSKALIVLLERV